MAKRRLIRRLVEEIKHEDLTEEENLPLEYYELKELAKTRVLLKGSLKIHAIIYLFLNVFVIILNLFAISTTIVHFFDLWFFHSWLKVAAYLTIFLPPNLVLNLFVLLSSILLGP